MADLFLIAPPDANAADIGSRLERVLATTDAAALLVPRGTHAENVYKALVKAVVPIAQQKDVAVLIEGAPGDVRKLGADGLHVRGDIEDVRDAIAALKPEFIVGAVAEESRHDAMSKGELDVDYVFFGPLSGPTDPATRDLARWWAETMEVPGVLSDPEADATGDAAGCEFLAVGARVWEMAR